MSATRPLLVVAGLAAESRIAAGPGIVTVAAGGIAARLKDLLAAEIDRGVQAILSFGIAGGLDPRLRPGSLVVARWVDDGGTRHAADEGWAAALARALPNGTLAGLAGSDEAVCNAKAKAGLHARTEAVAVDMESHIAARFARRHGLPFAALRIVADPALRVVPKAALVGLKPDGSTDVGAVLRALARNPRELPALMRTALDADAAFRELRALRRRLGTGLGMGTAPVAVPVLADPAVSDLAVGT